MLNEVPREVGTAAMPRDGVNDTLLQRVQGEFWEMPGMRLTLEQAMRLWALDCRTCIGILEALVAAHFLERDLNGRYARAHSGY